ncbi:nucleotide-binding alpha-beta plait domain-containing protein [Tanacetum coccineum]
MSGDKRRANGSLPKQHTLSCPISTQDNLPDGISLPLRPASNRKDGFTDTVLPRTAMDKVKHKYVNSLVGDFIGKNLAFHVVQNYVTNTWAKFRFEKLMKTDDGVFLFKFAAKMGMDQVLKRGPWIIRNMPLILNKWTPSLSLKKDEVTKIPIWVKMHNVPIVAYSDGLSLIATQIGKPIMLDAFTCLMCEDHMACHMM